MKQLTFICLSMLMVACHSNSPTVTMANYILKGDTIMIPDNSNLKEKIKTTKVSAIPYRQKLSASGIVKAIPNNYAQIASPFAGRIIKSFIKLGDRVQVNAPIFEISSPSFFEAGKDYYKAKQEMQLAEKKPTSSTGFIEKWRWHPEGHGRVGSELRLDQKGLRKFNGEPQSLPC